MEAGKIGKKGHGELKMGEKMKNYLREMDYLLDHAEEHTDWISVLEEHRIQIGFFQHERLIHLLVTLVFAILSMAVFLLDYFRFSLFLSLLLVLFLLLLIPYVFHYFHLENGVQKMYRQYDLIMKRSRKSKKDML